MISSNGQNLIGIDLNDLLTGSSLLPDALGMPSVSEDSCFLAETSPPPYADQTAKQKAFLFVRYY